MIILDTNVISELARPQPEPRVRDWVNAQARGSLWLTTVSAYELRYGTALLPPGRRKIILETGLGRLLTQLFENRVLVLTIEAAQEAAELSADRERRGMIVDLSDTLIAGIALSRRATLATRNVRHFADLEVQVVDPWATSG